MLILQLTFCSLWYKSFYFNPFFCLTNEQILLKISSSSPKILSGMPFVIHLKANGLIYFNLALTHLLNPIEFKAGWEPELTVQGQRGSRDDEDVQWWHWPMWSILSSSESSAAGSQQLSNLLCSLFLRFKPCWTFVLVSSWAFNLA